MNLLRELTEEKSDHMPIMEAVEAALEEAKVGVKGSAKNFFSANQKLVVGAASMAVSAKAAYQRNKKFTVSLHAKDAYERRMITSIVDALTKAKKFKVVRTKFQSGGKTWVLKKV